MKHEERRRSTFRSSNLLLPTKFDPLDVCIRRCRTLQHWLLTEPSFRLHCHNTGVKLFSFINLEVVTLTVDIRGGRDKWGNIHLHTEKHPLTHFFWSQLPVSSLLFYNWCTMKRLSLVEAQGVENWTMCNLPLFLPSGVVRWTGARLRQHLYLTMWVFSVPLFVLRTF